MKSSIIESNYQRIIKLPKVTFITLHTYYKMSLTVTNQYMGLLPLWYGVMLRDLSRYVSDVNINEER